MAIYIWKIKSKKVKKNKKYTINYLSKRFHCYINIRSIWIEKCSLEFLNSEAITTKLLGNDVYYYYAVFTIGGKEEIRTGDVSVVRWGREQLFNKNT